MPILNYTTSVPVERTIAEIQGKLVSAGATAVLCEYRDGAITHISFRVQTKHGELAFRLPANVEGVYVSMVRAKGVSRSKKTKAQASRVAWRILKDWLEAQFAIIEAGMATLPQVFLPYAQTSQGTVYERFERYGTKALGGLDQSIAALPPASEEGEG